MKKWYFWLILALIFGVGGAINFLNGDRIIGQVIQVGIAVVLAAVQFFLDKKNRRET